jgi:signal transduction histidine kinase
MEKMGNNTDRATLAACFGNETDLKSSFECLVTELDKELEIERVSLSWVEGDSVVIAAFWSRVESDLSIGLTIPLKGKFAELAVKQGTSRLDHGGKTPGLRSILQPGSSRKGYFINIPLNHGGETYGLLTVYGGLRQPFAEADRMRVEEICQQVNPELAGLFQREVERERFARLERQQRERLLFINSVAHELKTPLTAIMASGGLLQEELSGSDSANKRRLVENMMSAAGRLDARLNELLAAARSEKVGFTLKPELVDLRYVIQNTAKMIQPMIESRQQALTLDLPERVPLVKGDRQRLEQVILNLLNNANKYSPVGGKISLQLRPEPGRLVVSVTDNGPGIPAEDQSSMFQPYFRREADRERYQGMGLGLAICKQLVEQHGGRIWLMSRPGEGATFAFSLPLTAEEQPGEGIKSGDKA